MQPSTFQNPFFGISLGLIGIIVGYALGSGLLSTNASQPTVAVPAPTQVAQRPAPSSPPPAPAANPATADDDIAMGDENATVTLIEFSDFQCPFCRRFFRDTLPEIKTQYIDTGKVKFVYRDYPLGFHPMAMPSARAMECAEEQSEKIAWAVHDEIFKGQDTRGQGTIQYTVDDIKTWAANAAGLDTQKFNDCLDSDKYTDEVNADIADGSASGVSGTPGFWVIGPDGTGQQISGAQPFASFQAAFDRYLQ